MSSVKLINVNKVYDNNVQAVFDFNLDIKDKEFIVFVGPSGCGKSTTLRMIAGLEDISDGELYIDDVLSNEIAPKNRDIAMVFQNYALYPHMSVYENMAFGLKNRHVPKEEIKARVHAAAEILGITEYLQRKPKALSGGQCQRVALGRAIVRQAKVFLMDEPLSNLDAKLRVQMRSEIIKLHKRIGSTTIYVTHDQTEAMTMADRIVVMKGGYIQQIGTPREIYNKPANKFVAGFMGSPSMNFIDASLSLGNVNVGGYEIKLSQEQTEILKCYYLSRLDSLNLEIEAYDNKIFELENRLLESKDDKKESAKLEFLHEKALTLKSGLLEELDSINNFLAGEKIETILGIRPEDITLSLEEKEGYYKTSVDVTELLGKEQIVHFTMNSHEVLAQLSAKYEVNMQDELFVLFNNEHIHLFDKNNEETIL